MHRNKSLLRFTALSRMGAGGQHLLHLTPPQEHRQPAHEHGGQTADGHAEPVVQDLPQRADGQRQHRARRRAEQGFIGVEPGTQPVWDIALYCRLTDGGALDPQKAAESPVHQHQGVRQPQEAGVHQLIGLIYPEQEAEPLSLRQGKAVADNSADGAPGELRYGEKGIHGGGEALRRAEEGNEQGSVAHSHTVGDSHVRIQTRAGRCSCRR